MKMGVQLKIFPNNIFVHLKARLDKFVEQFQRSCSLEDHRAKKYNRNSLSKENIRDSVVEEPKTPIS